MSIVYVHLVGANVYVPHASGTRLLAVLPNATRLGESPECVADGTKPATHRPVLYEERDVDGRLALMVPESFVGSRLTFEFSPSPALELSAIMPLAKEGWFDIDPIALSETPGDGVAGQVLITAGKVSVYRRRGRPCNATWRPPDLGKSLVPLVRGLTVEVPSAFRVRAWRTSWVTDETEEILNRKVAFGKIVHLFAGNLCAEDILDWTKNSSHKVRRNHDNDFKWLLALSKASAVSDYLRVNNVLPVPEVDGGPVEERHSVSEAFGTILSGGGGAACQCQGCVERPRNGY